MNSAHSLAFEKQMPEEPSSPLLSRFAAMAQMWPQTPACISDTRCMSFQELDSISNDLARQFLLLCADSPGPVALHLNWSPEVLAASLAAAKAGLAYIPFDAAWPETRMRNMLKHTGARILAVSPETLLPDSFMEDATVLVLNLSQKNVTPASAMEAHPPAVRADSPLYILFTSGSTGEPKGVVVTHANVAAMLTAQDFPGFEPGGRRIAASCSLGFDASVLALWGGMLNACTVVCAPRETFLDARRCRSYFNRHAINYAALPVAVFNALAGQDPALFGSLDKLIIGGESPNSAICKKVLQTAPPGKLYNNYGPTECTVFITAEHIEQADEHAIIPAGRPVSAGYLRIVDESLAPLPAGEWGEVLIGGKGVAAGYHNAPAQTEKAFIPDPENPAQTVYRTGDRGMLSPDGRLTISGRLDTQVKISGARVELGELGAALNASPGVQTGHVTHIPEYGLIAYAVIDAKAAGVTEDNLRRSIRDFLAGLLPSYMLPHDIIFISTLPLNANGKVDASRLPLPAALQPPGEETPGRNTSGGFSVLECFRSVLRDRNYTADDSFLSRGGSSLSAARLIGVLQKHTGVWVPLELFSHAQTSAVVEMFINAAALTAKRLPPQMKKEQVRL